MIVNDYWHILSLMVFFGLLYALAKAQRRIEFQRRMMQALAMTSSSAYVLDWPHKFLARVSSVATRAFSYHGVKLRTPPEKFYLRPWSMLIFHPAVKGLDLSTLHEHALNSKNYSLTIILTQPADDIIRKAIADLEKSHATFNITTSLIRKA